MGKLLSVLVSLLIGSSAYAQFVIAPGLNYSTSSVEQNGGESESNSTTIDLKVGYILPMGLYVGGMYSLIDSESCNGGCTDTGGNLVGPSVGYFSMMGFYTLLTYHIMGERNQGASSKYTGAQGPQVDLGWVFPLSSYFSIGPQISWRSIEFDKFESNGTSTDTDLKATTIEPYISLWFMFKKLLVF